ncbi:MAG: type III-A CRISPR-associated RAMP protein Csm5 [Lewinellaceae bacterium]|nr:type III-A CRISPR-associated RAMP protein Csm5 [Lewinellaceae bacterium]
MNPEHLLNCTLEILTPVHVGSGEKWQQHVDFLIMDREVIIIDQEKIYNELLNIPANDGRTALDVYTYLLSKANLFKLEAYLRDLDIEWKDKALAVFHYQREEPAQEIGSLIRTMSQPYIPGSSIKGAIASVIINTVKRKRNLDTGKYRNERSDWKFIDDTVGRFERAISRYLRPSDVEIADTELHNIQLFNLYQNFDWESDYKNPKLLTLETFAVGAKGQFQIAIDVAWLELAEKYKVYAKNEKLVINRKQPIQELFYLINRYTYEHLQKEVAFFQNYNQAEDSESIIATLKDLQAQTIDNEDACILRMAYGSGFHAITGDWMFGSHLTPIDQSHKGKRYKSRKLANYLPMGFVKITLPDGVPRLTPWKILGTPDTAKRPATIPAKLKPDYVNYEYIKKDKPISAEVIKLSKPFSTVKLHIENYPFEDLMVEMSGTKKAKLKEGQIVKVLINSQTADGQIKTVKYLKS